MTLSRFRRAPRDTIGAVLALAAATTVAEADAARLAAINSGALGYPVDCAGRHSVFLGCPVDPYTARYTTHPPLTLAARIGNVTAWRRAHLED